VRTNAAQAEPEPALEPQRGPGREPASGSEPQTSAVDARREWNVWDLERMVRDRVVADVARDEERSFLLMYLRDFAGADGQLPADFDALVRDSFGDLIAAASP
jgi:hypothetical protein